MAVETITMRSLLNAHDAIIAMTKGVGPSVMPCATADGGEICANATSKGCTSKRDGGLVYTPGGVECPRQFGTLIMIGTNGSVPVSPR